MATLLIYDNDGKIFTQITGDYVKPNGGVQFLETEIPPKKIVKGIDTSGEEHVVLFEDIPKTEIETLMELVEEQEAALIEIAEMLLGGNE